MVSSGPTGLGSPTLHLRGSVIGAGRGEQRHSDWMRGSVVRRRQTGSEAERPA